MACFLHPCDSLWVFKVITHKLHIGKTWFPNEKIIRETVLQLFSCSGICLAYGHFTYKSSNFLEHWYKILYRQWIVQHISMVLSLVPPKPETLIFPTWFKWHTSLSDLEKHFRHQVCVPMLLTLEWMLLKQGIICIFLIFFFILVITTLSLT